MPQFFKKSQRSKNVRSNRHKSEKKHFNSAVTQIVNIENKF